MLIGFVGMLGAEDKNATAERLFDSARQVSDIRSSASKPFRLEAQIKLVGGGAKEGEYLEMWQSPTRWRRELTIGDYHYVQVSDPNDEKHSWVIEPSELAGFGRETLGFLLLNELEPNSWKVGKVFDRDKQGVQLTCIETKESGEKRTLCFDRLTKGLQSVRYSSLLSHWQHEYSQYIVFGGFNFPGRIKSKSSDGESLEIVVTDLAPESGGDTSVFARPPNSERRPVCRVATPPRLLSSDDRGPGFTRGNHKAVFGLVVGIDGRPHNLRVIDFTDQNYASAAGSIVQSWTFTPSLCQGEAIPTWYEVIMGSTSPY
jgi:hypothetical protein